MPIVFSDPQAKIKKGYENKMDNNDDLKQRLERFRMLCEMAWADGKIQPEENELLKQKVKELNIPLSEAKKVFNEVHSEKYPASAKNSSSTSNSVKVPQEVSSDEMCNELLNSAGNKLKVKDLDGAIEDYDEAIRINPKEVEAYLNRGYAKRDKGDSDGAIKDYDEAIRLNPKFDLAYNNRGIAKYEKGDLDGAIKDYNEAIRINPEDCKLYFFRANIKFEQHDYDGAIKDYNEAIRLNPIFGEAYHAREMTLTIKSLF